MNKDRLSVLLKNKKFVFGGAVAVVVLIVACVLIFKPKDEPAHGPVLVEDLSVMTQDEIIKWCGNNSVACSISKEFKENTNKDQFISQSIAPGEYVADGEMLKIVFSLGSIPAGDGYAEATEMVKLEADARHTSKAKLYDRVKEKYNEEVAKWAVENAPVDWETICLARAADYYRGSAYDTDKDAVLQQYKTKHEIREALRKDGFTESEIDFAIKLINSTVDAEVES